MLLLVLPTSCWCFIFRADLKCVNSSRSGEESSDETDSSEYSELEEEDEDSEDDEEDDDSGDDEDDEEDSDDSDEEEEKDESDANVSPIINKKKAGSPPPLTKSGVKTSTDKPSLAAAKVAEERLVRKKPVPAKPASAAGSSSEASTSDKKKIVAAADSGSVGADGTKVDEYAYDSSDEEDIRNTIGNIPTNWYDEYGHIGYDLEGKKIRNGQIVETNFIRIIHNRFQY